MMKPEHQAILLEIARVSISTFLETGKQYSPDLKTLPEELQEHHATFVTLHLDKRLRGCIGMLEACRPLAQDVAENAYSAAFEDPRFPQVTQTEFPNIKIHISALSTPAEITCTSEQDLLSKIRPNVDGLILDEHGRRGTFLPSVWEELPTPELFLAHLKMKAGLPTDYWSDTIRVFRYTAEYFGE